ncbi:hypothetical protein HRbin33_02420 [bacterium HR33]|nr:hypothetical protein HRbin33_02420 [bacterium HR33]
MSPLLKLALLLVGALLISRISWRPRFAAAGVTLLIGLGTHFLAVGVLLGPVTGILSREVVQALAPFLMLGLGWVGMLMGMQLDREQLRQFSSRLPLATVTQGFLAFAVAWVLAWAIVELLGLADSAWSPWGPAILTLCAVTAVSAPAAVALVASRFRARGPVSRLLMYVASLDGLVGIAALAVVVSLYRGSAGSGIGVDDPWLRLGLLAAAGLLSGLLFVSLTRAKPSAEELVLFVGGTVLFASGIAYALELSPLAVCLIGGAVVANASRFRGRVYAMLASWEKPIYGILLVLAGAMLRPPDWWVAPLVLLLLAVRLIAKLFATWAAVRIVAARDVPRRLGLGLFANGGLALAIVINYALNYGSHAGADSAVVDTVFAAVVLAVAVTELAGPWVLKNVLARVGELGGTGNAAVAAGT